MQIFLTGATGFIGARLAECLTHACGAKIHTLIRRFDTVGMARLARLSGVQMLYGDIRDSAAVMKAAEGCSHIIHCATGDEETTVEGTRNVLEAAVRLEAARVVYFSSASVHDPARSGKVIREGSSLNGRPVYARVKVLAEAVVSEYHQRYHVPTVVLRPTCVWGPFSSTWTVAPVELIRKGIPFLPLQGKGMANTVYIDNLVDAVYLALTRSEPVGQTFLINDDAPQTWGELYEGYAKFLGVQLALQHPGIKEMLRVSLHNARLISRKVLAGKSTLGIRTLREVYDYVPASKLLMAALPQEIRARLKGYALDRQKALQDPGVSSVSKNAPLPFLPFSFISSDLLEAYGTSGRYSNEKARRVLGWSPRAPFKEALETTCQWLEYAGFRN